MYVLDPCCGTGAYLVEVLKRIYRTLREKRGDALLANDVKRAAEERVFGFEILPAPFVVAHLQLGLLLQGLGVPLGEGERAGVYLTNALTGWEPAEGPQARLVFPELEHERDAAQHVKRETPILVVLGKFIPAGIAGDYLTWPLLIELFPASFPGVKTSRDDVVVDIDHERLVQRMQQYFDAGVGHEEMRRIAPGAMESTARFEAEAVRDRLRRRGFLPESVVRYCYRPFDIRWLYWEPEAKLLDEKREQYFAQIAEGNVWISAGQRNRMERFYQPQFTVRLADHHIVESNVSMFPLYLRTLVGGGQPTLFGSEEAGRTEPNMSVDAQAYVTQVGSSGTDVFHHSLAALHSGGYSQENASALRQDWPRIPLPATREALLASAELGRQVAALLNTESGVRGVTLDPVRAELRPLAIVSTAASETLVAGDLAVTAGWGHAGKGGVTMPGKGRLVERDYTAEERAAIEAGAAELGTPPDDAFGCLGGMTCDIYLNDDAYWRNVPAKVWGYTIGGYQVIKKWLSYRERSILGRALTPEEARYVTEMARRIAAIVLLQPRLDANYRAVTQDVYSWAR